MIHFTVSEQVGWYLFNNYPLSYLVLLTILFSGETLQLLDDGFHHLLMTLAKSYHSSPYFLRCYEELCVKYRSEGSRNAVLIGLKRVNVVDDVVGSCKILGGYILGEIVLSRSSLTADIFLYTYVCKKWRDSGNGAKLYRCFEDTVKERSASVGVKVTIVVRIPMKPCIVKSFSFWRNLGFEGFGDSVCLIKKLK